MSYPPKRPEAIARITAERLAEVKRLATKVLRMPNASQRSAPGPQSARSVT
jgi:hypothetical protein